MNTVSQEMQDMAIKSLESTYNKLTKSYISMSEKGANTILVIKRRDAVKVGLESLKCAWNGEDFFHDAEIIMASKAVLHSVLPSIEKQIKRAKEGSPQKTVNERRIIALKLAIRSLEERV